MRTLQRYYVVVLLVVTAFAIADHGLASVSAATPKGIPMVDGVTVSLTCIGYFAPASASVTLDILVAGVQYPATLTVPACGQTTGPSLVNDTLLNWVSWSINSPKSTCNGGSGNPYSEAAISRVWTGGCGAGPAEGVVTASLSSVPVLVLAGIGASVRNSVSVSANGGPPTVCNVSFQVCTYNETPGASLNLTALPAVGLPFQGWNVTSTPPGIKCASGLSSNPCVFNQPAGAVTVLAGFFQTVPTVVPTAPSTATYTIILTIAAALILTAVLFSAAIYLSRKHRRWKLVTLCLIILGDILLFFGQGPLTYLATHLDLLTKIISIVALPLALIWKLWQRNHPLEVRSIAFDDTPSSFLSDDTAESYLREIPFELHNRTDTELTIWTLWLDTFADYPYKRNLLTPLLRKLGYKPTQEPYSRETNFGLKEKLPLLVDGKRTSLLTLDVSVLLRIDETLRKYSKENPPNPSFRLVLKHSWGKKESELFPFAKIHDFVQALSDRRPKERMERQGSRSESVERKEATPRKL